ncbi:hypothetical protein CHS0354_033361 [Potamilus streckersoni]|uniref:RRM domain-containing protein n=1 Tax=Potamilus streckersoni TaxID=2493646 RepID=A0AAE0RTC7_9BIVA|nr:hypothetical protein CHS0354_033361 [Potamilus streckersoni]
MAKHKKRVSPKQPSNVALNPDEQKKFEHDISEKRKQGGSTLKPGIIRLSHIPWGFFEHGIKDYFKQFGTVSRIRLSRSKKTGNSRGYAYIEFASEDVARIAAETMNNYLMFGKLLKCRFMDRVHPKLMKGANRKFRKPMSHIQDAKRHNKIKTEIQQTRSVRRFLGAYKKKMNKLEAQGINYELDGIEQLQDKAKSKMTDKKSDRKDAIPGDLVEESPKEMCSKIPLEVHTPKGTLQVLKEDSSDEEIAFKTPPFSIKSSKLDKRYKKGRRK